MPFRARMRMDDIGTAWYDGLRGVMGCIRSTDRQR